MQGPRLLRAYLEFKLTARTLRTSNVTTTAVFYTRKVPLQKGIYQLFARIPKSTNTHINSCRYNAKVLLQFIIHSLDPRTRMSPYINEDTF